MSFNLANFLKAVEQVAPIVLTLVPGVPPVLIPFIIHGIQKAETIQGADGATKLAAAVDLVNNGVAALNTVKPGAVDANAVNSAVVAGINATISTINVINSAKTPVAPAPPTA